jgi:hypothetical protein
MGALLGGPFMKKCFKCQQEKPLSEFYKHPMMGDGHLNKCKECTKKDVRKNRRQNISHYRSYDRERGNRQTNEYRKDYRQRFPKKTKARRKVAYHVMKGDLTAKPCEVCGADKTVAHHDDYDKPLDVRWLCQTHHAEWHKQNGEGKNGI